jgi:hypothetical protein
MSEVSDSVSVSRRIPGPVGSVFAVLAEPRRHLELDGSGMLRGTDFTGSVTEVGEVFVMRMHHGPLGDYEMINHVVEFEQDRRISWEPESGRGHPDAGTSHSRWGHRWAFELTAEGPSHTVVTHTWDCSRAAQGEDGEPWKAAMSRTLVRLEGLCMSAGVTRADLGDVSASQAPC